MDNRVHVTIALDPADHAALRDIASEHEQSFDEIAVEALRARIDNERDFDEAVRAGLADIEAGRVITHEEYLAKAAERRRKWLAERAQ
jgi:predicted transcriptional regulator